MLVTLLLCLLATPAAAHKLTLFASIAGPEVSGVASFYGGGRAAGLAVEVLDGAGTTIAETTTDAEGRFRVAAPGAAAVRLRGSDGHEARQALTGDPTPAAGDTDMAREVRALREELAAWRAEVRWHDVLGGLGYIVGMAGLAYGLMGRRT